MVVGSDNPMIIFQNFFIYFTAISCAKLICFNLLYTKINKPKKIAPTMPKPATKIHQGRTGVAITLNEAKAIASIILLIAMAIGIDRIVPKTQTAIYTNIKENKFLISVYPNIFINEIKRDASKTIRIANNPIMIIRVGSIATIVTIPISVNTLSNELPI